MPRYILLFYLLGIQGISYSQEITSSDLDSLIGLGFKELQNKYYQTIKDDKPVSKLYAKAYLLKAKSLDSISEMARGFYWISSFFKNDYEKRFIYLDSALNLVKNTEHVLQTGSLYLAKGAYTQEKGDYDKALGYYLEGLEGAEKKDVLVYISIFRFKIAFLKRDLGKYEEAKQLYKKCLPYEKTQIGKKKNDSIRYLNTISEIISIYRLNKQIDSAYFFFKPRKRYG